MRHWSQLGIRNWRARKGRTAGALAAIALGVGVVVWVTCAYESVRRALVDQVAFWVGRSHLSVESIYGLYGVVPESIGNEVTGDPNVAAATVRLKHGMMLIPSVGADADPGPSTAPAGTAPASVPSIHSQLRELTTRPAADDSLALTGEQVQAVGVEPESESAFRQYDEDNIEGRMIGTGEADKAVVDAELAALMGLKLGDRFTLRNITTGTEAPVKEREGVFTIVGLIDMRRVAKKQKPVVIGLLSRIQSLTGKDVDTRSVTRVDMILKNTDPAAIQQTTERIRTLVRKLHPSWPITVTSAAAKIKQVQAAERQTQFVLLLISTVALFTAFFVILSTLSMGMIERIGQLGMLRCLGMTRLQIAALVLAEALPLGLAGIVLGVPVGLGLALLSVVIAPEYIGRFVISQIGLLLALAGGIITTLVGALFPMVQAMRVSPLTASRPQAQPSSRVLIWAAAFLGTAMIVGHSYMLTHMPPNLWFERPASAIVGVGLLYGGYALLAPALVMIIGQAAVRLAAWALRIRHRLLGDQVGRAAWRSAAICSGLMVGLSLVVSVVVHSESLARGWDFPKAFCEAFVYVTPPVPRVNADRARQTIAGLGKSCLVNEKLQCTVQGRSLFSFGLSYFVAGTPDEFFEIAQLEFVEGTQEEAIALLKKGGHVLVTPEFTRAQRVKRGDSITVSAAGRRARFKIAGVVTSPALDIAANYFNAGEALTMASLFVVLGTLEDLQRVFGMPDEVSMFLLNFDLPSGPDVPPPPEAFSRETPPNLDDAGTAARRVVEWHAAMPERAAEIAEVERALKRAEAENRPLRWQDAPLLRVFREAMVAKVMPDWSRLREAGPRWRGFREDLTLRLVARAAGREPDQYGSVAELKSRIDRDLRRATVLFATIPLVALVVAALGVANLMMANVVSRTRQIAMLRAIGATRWQVMRLVMGEALVLGALGCLLGVGLGLHAAHGMNTMTQAIWGYAPRWTIPTDLVGGGIIFTMLVCLLAGLLPARYAARSNVIDALQAT